jgi:hypothetical protein
MVIEHLLSTFPVDTASLANLVTNSRNFGHIRSDNAAPHNLWAFISTDTTLVQISREWPEVTSGERAESPANQLSSVPLIQNVKRKSVGNISIRCNLTNASTTSPAETAVLPNGHWRPRHG